MGGNLCLLSKMGVVLAGSMRTTPEFGLFRTSIANGDAAANMEIDGK